MLKKGDFIACAPHLADMRIDEQVSVNHTTCKAGIDTRHRFYIKRQTHKTWLGYCHNCGEGGIFVIHPTGEADSYDSNIESLASALSDALMYDVEHNDEEPNVETASKIQIDYDDFYWSPWAVARIHRSIPLAEAEAFGWKYSKEWDQIVTPMFSLEGEAIGYHGRNAPGTIPKCKVVYTPDFKGYPYVLSSPSTEDVIVVEDPLSALKIRVETGLTAVALLGTHLNDRAVHVLIKLLATKPNGRVWIWMDPDPAGKKACAQIAKRIYPLLGDKLRWVHSRQEAKDKKGLKGFLDGYIATPTTR